MTMIMRDANGTILPYDAETLALADAIRRSAKQCMSGPKADREAYWFWKALFSTNRPSEFAK